MDLERDVLAELRGHGVRIERALPCSWLTERGHLNPIVRREAPAEVVDLLEELHAELGGDRRALARKRDAPLRAGLRLVRTGQLVEVDDVGHFTSARLLTLSRYPAGRTFGFNLDLYRELIETWRERAAAVFTRRWSPDFDFPGGRRAQRAYEDVLHDLLTPVFTGLPLLRVAVPDLDVAAAAGRVAARLR